MRKLLVSIAVVWLIMSGIIGFVADLRELKDLIMMPVPLWVVGLACFIIAIIFHWLGSREKEEKKQEAPTTEKRRVMHQPEKPKKERKYPEWINYNRDEIEGVIWEWRWSWNIRLAEYEVMNLKPLCPKCSIELNTKPSWVGWERVTHNKLMFCDRPECDFTDVKKVDWDRIEREIKRRIKTGEWKERIKKAK